MKSTKMRMARVCAAAVLAMAALGVAGCATTGERPKTTEATATAPVMGKADFYADWYEASAVVLPPPPAPTTGGGKR